MEPTVTLGTALNAEQDAEERAWQGAGLKRVLDACVAARVTADRNRVIHAFVDASRALSPECLAIL